MPAERKPVQRPKLKHSMFRELDPGGKRYNVLPMLDPGGNSCPWAQIVCSLGWILVAILVPVFCLQQLLLFVHQWHLWWEQQLTYLTAQNEHADENRKVNCYSLHCQKQVTNTHVLVFQKTTHSASESDIDIKLAVKSLTWLTWCKASESDTKLTVKSLTWLTWSKRKWS